MRCICSSIVATLVLAGTSLAGTINVPGDYATIQAAIDSASDNDVITISPGTYQENLVVEGKSLSFVAPDGPEVTILDGGGAGSVLKAVAADAITLSMTGFTIQNGTGTDIGDGSSSGGGIAIDGNDLALSNCHVKSNAARYGGGIYLQYGSLHIESCVLSDNTAISQGGSVATHHADMHVGQSQFSQNSCSDNIGGAIACSLHEVGSLSVTDSTFDGNWAKEAGGAIETHANGAFVSVHNSMFSGNISSNGGAISSHEAPFTCSGSTFESNQATVQTTSQSGDGGAMWLQDTTVAALTNNSFLSNEGTSGGALMLHAVEQATVEDCAFANNIASHPDPNSGGGASHNIGCSPLYKNCTFSNNACPNNGNIGTAMYVWNGSLTFEDCTFCGHAGEAIGTFDNGNWSADGATSFTEICITDCNDNGIPDSEDIANFTSFDCDQNGVPDECQPDCDGDGWIDPCDSEGDIDGDGIPDNCEDDCNDNSIPDDTELKNGWATDCDGNLIPDECDIANDPSLDCDGNGALDSCEIEDDQSLDCNGNGTLDACDLGAHIPADAVQWTVEEGGNGHWYKAFLQNSPVLKWTEMQAEAQSMGGTLATPVTEAENNFIYDNLAWDPQLWAYTGNGAHGPALGGIRTGPDILNDWEWLTGEAWEDTNWGCSQPGGQDGDGHSENYLHYYNCTESQPDRIWNDIEDLYHGSNPVIGFIVEWEVNSFSLDCNANNIPDECDISDGTSNDANGNGIPDECEDDCNTNGVPDHWDIKTGTSEDCNINGIPDECDTANGTSNDVNSNSIPDECEEDCNDNGSPDDWDVVMGWSEDCNDNLIPDECELAAGESPAEGAVQWTVAEGGNGHWYKIAIANDDCFDAIRSVALSQFGDLAVIESVEENQFVTNLLIQDGDYWIGLRQNLESPDYSEPDGGWEWIDGTAFVYDNWRSGEEPNNAGSIGEDSCGIENDGSWYDMESCDFGGDQYAIIEWDLGSSASAPDCNTNGIPDECDIADETSEDINADGVPDECQCLADIDESNAVTIDDLLAVIGYWGSSSPAADLNSDGVVNITDLLIIFDQWGPCP